MGSDKGGLLVGKTDTNGGKGIIVQAPEGEIRMGGNEIIINAQAAKENCETLSQINQSTGGVAIPCDVKGNTDDHPATAEEVRKRAKMVDGGHVSKGKKNESVITKKTIEDVISGKKQVESGKAIQSATRYLRAANGNGQKNRGGKKGKGDKGDQANLLKKYAEIKTMALGDMVGHPTHSELDKATSDLHKAETFQNIMKTANAIIRSKKDVTARLVKEAGLTQEQAEKIQQKDFAGRIGFPSYKLTNNNANIKRLQDRVNMLTKKANAHQEVANTGKEEKYSFQGGEILVNYPADRVQLLFDSIPGSDIRTTLKKNGYKWSPTNSAWQRKITPQAISNAIYLMKAKKSESQSGQPQPQEDFNIGDFPRMLETRNFTYVSGNIYNAFEDKEYTGSKTFNLVYFGSAVGQNVIAEVKKYIEENLPFLDGEKISVNTYPKTYVREAKNLFEHGQYLPTKSFPKIVLYPMFQQLTNYLEMKKDMEKQEEMKELDLTEVPAIEVNPENFEPLPVSDKMKVLLIRTFDFLVEKYLDEKLHIVQKNIDVYFSGIGIKKLVHKAGETKCKSLFQIGEIIQTSVFSHTEPDKKNRADILKVWIFKNVIGWEGKRFEYRIYIDQRKDGHFVYSGNMDMKKPL